jgi:hypothetical protein
VPPGSFRSIMPVAHALQIVNPTATHGPYSA